MSDDDALARAVGARIREAREARGVSLRALAATVGLSPGMLSQLETGRSRPSVGTLYALVGELGLSLDALLSDGEGDDGGTERPAAPSGPTVQRDGERQVLELSGGVTWEQLDAHEHAAAADVVFALVTYQPGARTEEQPVRHAGREYGYLLSGRLVVRVDADEVELAPGDAITFASDRPHHFHAVGEEPARAVWFNRAT